MERDKQVALPGQQYTSSTGERERKKSSKGILNKDKGKDIKLGKRIEDIKKDKGEDLGKV